MARHVSGAPDGQLACYVALPNKQMDWSCQPESYTVTLPAVASAGHAAQVNAVQEQAVHQRNEVVSEALSELEGAALHQQHASARPQARPAGQCVTGQHASEHADALQTVSIGRTEQRVQADCAVQDALADDTPEAAETRERGTACEQHLSLPWAQPLHAVGRPVPAASEMSQQPAAHSSSLSRLGSSNMQASRATEGARTM